MHETKPFTVDQINNQNDALILNIHRLGWTVVYPNLLVGGRDFELLSDRKIVKLHPTFDTDLDDAGIMMKKLVALKNALKQIESLSNS